jgi:hypothetical protein
MSLHVWTAIAGLMALTFGIWHLVRKSASWFGDWGSPSFEVQGSGAIVQGLLEVLLGVFLIVTTALDYLGLVSFPGVLNAVKAFLEF